MTLIADNIRVTYGARTALNGVDLRAEAGELTAIVGPNGSGKSTLLGAITATLPYTGRVTLNGCDIQKQKTFLKIQIPNHKQQLTIQFTIK